MKIETANLNAQETHELLGHAITPMPIALISTVGRDGVFNASPFSFVTPLCLKPPTICISFSLKGGKEKDTSRNIWFTKDFVINAVNEAIIKSAIQTAADYPSNVDEMKAVGLTAIASDRVKSPRIAEAPVSLECRLVRRMRLGEGASRRNIIFGEVVLMHVRDEFCVDGKPDPRKLKIMGRVTQGIYCRTGDTIKATFTSP